MRPVKNLCCRGSGALQVKYRDQIRANDLVTVADREAELFLTPRLLDLVDGVVIGEEACASDPGLRARADAPVAWTVDPVDGTGNFVAGNERFCCMVALMNHGAGKKLDPVPASRPLVRCHCRRKGHGH